MSTAEIILIVIGCLTIVATVIVPVRIYRHQKRHEEETNEAIRKQALKELANVFLIDHEGEREYLPWCVIASALHRQKKHTRKIYTDFCRCSDEVQQEILVQAGFNAEMIKGSEWVDIAFKRIKEYIKDNQLGRDWLYDNAKYFHRGFERYREEEWKNTPSVFEPIFNRDSFRKAFGNYKIDIGTYIEEYLLHKLHAEDTTGIESPVPPIDYVEESQNLTTCDEIEACRWIIDIVYGVSVIAHNTNSITKDNEWRENLTDAYSETFEDRYYEVLLVIYYTFADRQSVTDEDLREKKHGEAHIKKMKRPK